jgi:hypothetical protein
LNDLQLKSFVTIEETEHVGGATGLGCDSVSGCDTSPVICDIVVLTENCVTVFC